MSSKTTSQPAKRARTPGSTASSFKGPQDVAEEWARVNDLVERRRLQNRLSQKNYRNKIRTRLEKLESLLDANANGKVQTPEKQSIQEVATPSPKPDSSEPKTQQPDSLSTAEPPADVLNPMSDFLGLSTEASFEKHAHNSHLHHEPNDGCLGEYQRENEYPSPDPSFGCPTSPSFSLAEVIDVCTAPISPPSDPISRPPLDIENIDPLFSPSLDPHPAAASTSPDMTSYHHFGGYTESYHPTMSASSPFLPGISPFLSYSGPGTSTGCEGTTVNPINVFPSPYQPLTTAPYPSHQQHQQQVQYVWVPFLVPMLAGVPPPPQPGLQEIAK